MREPLSRYHTHVCILKMMLLELHFLGKIFHYATLSQLCIKRHMLCGHKSPDVVQVCEVVCI